MNALAIGLLSLFICVALLRIDLGGDNAQWFRTVGMIVSLVPSIAIARRLLCAFPKSKKNVAGGLFVLMAVPATIGLLGTVCLNNTTMLGPEPLLSARLSDLKEFGCRDLPHQLLNHYCNKCYPKTAFAINGLENAHSVTPSGYGSTDRN